MSVADGKLVFVVVITLTPTFGLSLSQQPAADGGRAFTRRITRTATANIVCLIYDV